MTASPGEHVCLQDLATNPYPILAALRAEEPVAWVGQAGMWFVTRRADVLDVLRDPELFRTDSARSTIRDTFGEQMLSAEGERHRRYKSQCNAPFNARSVKERAMPLARHKVDALVDAFGDGPVDLRPALASELAVYMVGTVLGVPPSLHGTIRRWYDAFAAALANFGWDAAVRERGHVAVQEFKRAILPLIQTHHHGARDPSLLGALSSAGMDRLTDDEIVSNMLIVLFGGIETTESTILNVVWTLLHHRHAWDAVRADRALLPGAIEEAMRWEPAVQSCTRHVARPTALGGVPLAAGDVVQCMLGAANRDPDHFADPDRFDIDRPNSADHFSFGSGKHFCLGAALARAEVHVVLDTLLTRFPGLQADPDRPSAPYGYEFRSPPTLWVRLGARD
jgi:cytochrome P450